MLTTSCMFRHYIDTNNPQGMQLRRFKNRSLRVHLLHLLSIMSFKLGHVSIPKRPIFSPLFLFCAYDSSVLQNFKIFTHLLTNFSYWTLWWRKWRTTEFRMHYFNDRVRKAPNIYYFGAIFWNHDQEKKKLPVHRYISFSHRLLMITTNLIKYCTM